MHSDIKIKFIRNATGTWRVRREGPRFDAVHAVAAWHRRAVLDENGDDVWGSLAERTGK